MEGPLFGLLLVGITLCIVSISEGLLLDNEELMTAYMNCTQKCEKSSSCRQATFLTSTSTCLSSVDGAWSPWSSWQPCSAECGSTGFQDRTRTCSDPPRQHGGTDCDGLTTEQAACIKPYGSSPDCPATWTEWSSWSDCLAECGGNGETQRQRQCQGGTDCQGKSTETQSCQRPWGLNGCPDAFYRVRVVSEGGPEDSLDPDSPLVDLQSSMFYIRDIAVSEATRQPGLNVVVLDRASGNVTDTKVFAGDELSKPDDVLTPWLEAVPADSVILTAVLDDAGDCGKDCMNVWQTFGAKKKSLGYRDSYALIAYKGWGCGWSSQPSWIQEDHEPYPGSNHESMTPYVDVSSYIQSICDA